MSRYVFSVGITNFIYFLENICFELDPMPTPIGMVADKHDFSADQHNYL